MTAKTENELQSDTLEFLKAHYCAVCLSEGYELAYQDYLDRKREFEEATGSPYDRTHREIPGFPIKGDESSTAYLDRIRRESGVDDFGLEDMVSHREYLQDRFRLGDTFPEPIDLQGLETANEFPDLLNDPWEFVKSKTGLPNLAVPNTTAADKGLFGASNPWCRVLERPAPAFASATGSEEARPMSARVVIELSSAPHFIWQLMKFALGISGDTDDIGAFLILPREPEHQRFWWDGENRVPNYSNCDVEFDIAWGEAAQEIASQRVADAAAGGSQAESNDALEPSDILINHGNRILTNLRSFQALVTVPRLQSVILEAAARVFEDEVCPISTPTIPGAPELEPSEEKGGGDENCSESVALTVAENSHRHGVASRFLHENLTQIRKSSGTREDSEFMNALLDQVRSIEPDEIEEEWTGWGRNKNERLGTLYRAAQLADPKELGARLLDSNFRGANRPMIVTHPLPREVDHPDDYPYKVVAFLLKERTQRSGYKNAQDTKGLTRHRYYRRMKTSPEDFIATVDRYSAPDRSKS